MHTHQSKTMRLVSQGQKVMILAVMLGVLGAVTLMSSAEFGWTLRFVAGTIAIVGIFMVAKGMGHSARKASVYAFLSIVPEIGILVLLWLNTSATKHLRAAGLRVRLLGA